MLANMRVLVLGLLSASVLVVHAQPPAISQNGIVNSASQLPSALTGASIARESRFTIKGVRLGTAIETRVILKHGEKSILVPVISINQRQIEAWMPVLAALGSGSLTVETSAGTSNFFPVAVVRTQLGLFSTNGKGWGPGRIDNLGSDGRRTPNSMESPARPGQTVEVWATGLGYAQRVDIIVGGHAASILSAHRTEKRGFDSIRFRLPADAPKGCYVPAYARVPGSARSNIVTLTIAHQFRCELPAGTPVAPGHKLGVIGISRTVALFDSSQPAITVDEAFAAFSEHKQTVESNRLLLLPPAGTCTTYTALYHDDLNEFESVAAALANPGDARTLDAGVQFTISVAGAARAIPHSGPRPGVYWTRLGFKDPSSTRSLPLFLNHPQYAISTPGGKDVAATSVLVTDIPTFEWTNRDALSIIQRARGAAFEWRGIPHDALVLILMASFDPLSTAGEIGYCAIPANAGRMHVPPEIFAHFPATGHIAGPFRSGAALIALRLQDEASTVRGLDLLRLVSVFANARRVEYR